MIPPTRSSCKLNPCSMRASGVRTAVDVTMQMHLGNTCINLQGTWHDILWDSLDSDATPTSVYMTICFPLTSIPPTQPPFLSALQNTKPRVCVQEGPNRPEKHPKRKPTDPLNATHATSRHKTPQNNKQTQLTPFPLQKNQPLNPPRANPPTSSHSQSRP